MISTVVVAEVLVGLCALRFRVGTISARLVHRRDVVAERDGFYCFVDSAAYAFPDLRRRWLRLTGGRGALATAAGLCSAHLKRRHMEQVSVNILNVDSFSFRCV